MHALKFWREPVLRYAPKPGEDWRAVHLHLGFMNSEQLVGNQNGAEDSVQISFITYLVIMQDKG